MMSGEVKTLKFAEDKPKDCKFCYYWGGKGGDEVCNLIIFIQSKQTSMPFIVFQSC